MTNILPKKDLLSCLDESQDLSSQSLLDLIDEISLQIPPEEWAKLPNDMSINLDHYLYGLPKSKE